MLSTLIIALVLLFAIALIGRRFIVLPNNVWLLFLAQPLAMCSASMVVFAGGLIASKIAPDPELATLPLTLMILGTASAVIPASMLMKKFGRRVGTIIGLSWAIVGSLLCMYSAIRSIFWLLVVGAILLGASMAFVAQMRFAAIESLKSLDDSPKAISVLMVGGMFAAVLGPEAAVVAKDWIDSPFGFAGSFLALSILILASIAFVAVLKPIGVKESHTEGEARSLTRIVKQPIFLIAVCSGAIAYSVMSYIMTATPLSMHEVDGHSLHDTKWVIQSHIVAMYLPSLFSALLIRYIGIAKLMIIGSLIYVAVIIVGMSGSHVMHYWWTMVLLGIGWNFLFTSGTLLLPKSYNPQERFKTQATNDFSIFLVQAMASLSAGMILFSQGWSILLSISVPVILIMFVVSIWYFIIHKRMS